MRFEGRDRRVRPRDRWEVNQGIGPLEQPPRSYRRGRPESLPDQILLRQEPRAVADLRELITDLRPTRAQIIDLLVQRFGENSRNILRTRQLGYVAEAHLRLAILELSRVSSNGDFEIDPIEDGAEFEGFRFGSNHGSVVVSDPSGTVRAEFDGVFVANGVPVVIECKSGPIPEPQPSQPSPLLNTRVLARLNFLRRAFGEDVGRIGFAVMFPENPGGYVSPGVAHLQGRGAYPLPFPADYYRDMLRGPKFPLDRNRRPRI